MQTKTFYLYDGGFSIPSDRSWCSSAAGNHERSSDADYSVETYASYDFIRFQSTRSAPSANPSNRILLLSSHQSQRKMFARM